MKLIVGLGNPGEKYKHTRHNAGFLALDYLLKDDGYLTAAPSHEFKSEVFTWLVPSKTEGQSGKNKVLFLKPQTFMNDSGQALKLVCNFYKMDLAKDLLVVHDDSDLRFGDIRTTDGSSSAGHKGVQSIIDNLGTQDFHRIRVGVESRVSRDELPTEEFVLQKFTGEEQAKFQKEILPKIEKEIKTFLKIEN
jgi:PTH1 family peptidyl-tRNA hydrolase